MFKKFIELLRKKYSDPLEWEEFLFVLPELLEIIIMLIILLLVKRL